MEQQFINKGYEIVKSTEIADIYVVNTCTVTNVAERKSRQMLRRVKQKNPSALLVVCGCYVEVAKSELEKIEEIDLIINSKEKKDIVTIIEQFERGEDGHIEDNLNEFIDFGSVTYTEKNRAVIKVQDGCNMFCTYCIIPYARGRIRSRKIESVVAEVTDIAKKGIKEVVITGIHVASYGKDWKDNNIGLIDLLEEINKIDGIKRIRLGSLEPSIVTPEFLERLTKLEKICDHFHLSLQSGCDETLKRMNRKYTTSQFKEITQLLRNAYPEVSLTTDVIVGFPGETEEEFNKTYEFLKDIRFYRMHVFKYSPRRGTPAEKMENQVDGNIKEKRSRKLIELSNKNEIEKNESYIGKNVKVLFEEYENGYFKGHTSNYIMVNVEGKETDKFVNQIKEIEIIKNDKINKELIGK